MHKVFESTNVSEIILVRDALERHDIEVTIQNENAGLGFLSGVMSSAEIWVTHDADGELAQGVVAEAKATMSRDLDAPEWLCSRCHEDNPPTFEVCWNCGTGRNQAADHA